MPDRNVSFWISAAGQLEAEIEIKFVALLKKNIALLIYQPVNHDFTDLNQEITVSFVVDPNHRNPQKSYEDRLVFVLTTQLLYASDLQ